MKYSSILTLVAFLVVSAGSAFGQESDDVNVTANVLDDLSVVQAQDVAFGSIQVNIQSYIQANENDTESESNLGAGAQAGQVDVSGANEEDIFVSWNTDVELSRDGGNDEISFTPTIYNDEDELTTPAGTVTSLDTAGDAQLDIGGTLASIANSGQYSTEHGTPLTITVTYNN